MVAILWALFLILLHACLLQAQDPGTLDLRVTSEGKAAAARIYIVDPAGHGLRIPGAVTYTRREEVNSTIDAHATVTLPPGRYHVRAEKGMEYGSAVQDVEIRSGATAHVSLDIPRSLNLNAQGWYSGDLHIHRDPREMQLIVRAENLNVAPVITRHVGGPKRAGSEPFPSTDRLAVDATHVVSLHNQEVERLFAGYGAVIFLNAPHAVEAPKFDLFPMDLEFCRQARRDGAFLDAEKPIWKNVPVDVAFGMVDAMGVVNNHFHPGDVWADAEKYGAMPQPRPADKTPQGFAQWVLELYYSFLNCGFRIPVSAGSASGVMTSWPGYERVYVHLDGPFRYDDWFRGLKAGHSFATNGPVLLVTANGQLPGSELPWLKPMDVQLAIEAHGQSLLDRIEIVANGQVLRSIRSGQRDFHQVLPVHMEHPGWLAVRCFEPAGATVRYAHISPFWLTKNGRLPVLQSDAERWADYVGQLAGSVNAAQYPSAAEYDKAQQVFREAARIYRESAESFQ